MYRKILVPVDLSHLDALAHALQTAVDLSRHYQATLCYVTISHTQPGPAAHSVEELKQKMEAFATEQGKDHGIDAQSHVIVTPDVTTDLDKKLVQAVEDCGADLVVMASHKPGLGDWLHLLGSHASKVVKMCDQSVFVVR